jgi:hypothetical protein
LRKNTIPEMIKILLHLRVNTKYWDVVNKVVIVVVADEEEEFHDILINVYNNVIINVIINVEGKSFLYLINIQCSTTYFLM